MNVFSGLLKSGWLADISLRTNDGVVFPAHKGKSCARRTLVHSPISHQQPPILWRLGGRASGRDGIVAATVILCARCEYLQAMFDPHSNWRESRQAETPIDCDSAAFRVVLQYMYTATATLDADVAPRVLAGT